MSHKFTPFTYDLGTTKREFIKARTSETSDRKFPDDSFMVIDIGDVLKKHEEWVRVLPSVTPFFAVKCMPYTPLLNILASLGAGFDCASMGEIESILSLGVSPSRIVYSNTRKQRSYISYAAKNNVDLMTFDDESEVLKINEIFPTARLLLRLSIFDRTAHAPFGFKFGCHHKNVKHVLESVKEQNMNVVGVHFHIGSGSQNPSLFESAIQFAKKIFDVGKDLGFDMNILDIGGGFPGSRRSNHSFTHFTDAIREALHDNFPADSGVTIIAEPGRYYVESAGTLVTNVIGIKNGRPQICTDTQCTLPPKRIRQHLKCQSSSIQQRTSRGGSISHFAEMSGLPPLEKPMNFDYMLFVNDGVFTSFLRNLFGFPLTPPQALKEDNEDNHYLCMIMGQSCPEEDVIVDDCCLPQLEVGDWIIFEDMGAYTCMQTGFNGFPKPYIYYAVPQKAWPSIQSSFAACKEATDQLLRNNNNNNLQDECDSIKRCKELLRDNYSLKEL